MPRADGSRDLLVQHSREKGRERNLQPVGRLSGLPQRSPDVHPEPEILAGGQYAEGTLYYFLLRPEYVQEYLAKAKGTPRSG